MERDLWSGSADLYGIGWRGVLTKGEFFVFGFVVVLFVVLVVLAVLVLLSPFSARRRPRSLIDIGLGAIGVVGMVEDRAERRPNMRNKSSTFRYWGAYLIYRSLTVRKFLTTLYIGGGGDNIRYVGGGDSSSDGGSDALFSSGGGNRIRGIGDKSAGKGVGKYEGRLCNCFWHSSRRYRCS